jgi:tRNA threonylcarbamoyladenosine biosynthesis protein TsaB
VRVLAIESATPTPSVALVQGDRVLAERAAGTAARGSELLLPAVDALLRDAGLVPDGLDGFAVAIGPGSFTWLRVGLATLKGLAFGDARPVAAVPTLAAVARRAGEPRSRAVAALLDARRGDVYAAAWAAGADPEPCVPEGLHRPERLAEALPTPCWLVGDAAEAHLAALRAGAPGEVAVWPGGAVGLGAGHVGVLGARALRAGQGVPASELVPRYVRRAEAEARRTGRAVEGRARGGSGPL